MNKARLFMFLLLIGAGLCAPADTNRSAAASRLAPQAGPCAASAAANGQCVKYDEGAEGAEACPNPLRGWLYKPASGGRRPAIIWNHGSEQAPPERLALAQFYTNHGYVFFTPHRAGHGMSAAAGHYIVDREAECGNDPYPNECKAQLHDQANADVVEAVKWLRRQPFVDPERIAMSGGSYGGIQTILTAEKGLHLRAFVPFAPAPQSFGNPFHKYRLYEAVRNAPAPIFLIQAENDYSIEPYNFLGVYLKTIKGGLNTATLYPEFCCTQQDAHGKFAISNAGIAIWGDDVLAFLNAAMN